MRKRRVDKNSFNKKLLFSIMIICIYIIGNVISIPWCTAESVQSSQFNLSEVLFFLSGNNSYCSILSLGIFPWMTASIIMMIFSLGADDDNIKISQKRRKNITRILTVIIAIIQSIVVCNNELEAMLSAEPEIFRVLTMLILVIGAVITMILIETNTYYGFGGASILILVSILAKQIPQFFTYENISIGEIILISIICLIAFVGTIIFERNESKNPINHVMIHNDLAGYDNLSIKWSPSGVMPEMFGMTIIMLFYYIFKLIDNISPNGVSKYFIENLNLFSLVGILFYTAALFALNALLARAMLSPKRIATSLMEQGDYIIGVRPGIETKNKIKRDLSKYCFLSDMFMFVAVVGPLLYRLFIGSTSQIYVLPMTIMIIVSISINVFVEMKASWEIDRYAV